MQLSIEAQRLIGMLRKDRYGLDELEVFIFNPKEPVEVRMAATSALIRKARFHHLEQEETWQLLCKVAKDSSLPLAIREKVVGFLKGDQSSASLHCLTTVALRGGNPRISSLAIRRLAFTTEGLEKGWIQEALMRGAVEGDTDSVRFHAAVNFLDSLRADTASGVIYV